MKHADLRRALIFAALVMAGAALTAAGIAVGGPEGVLRKAAVICLECVGIG